MAEPLRVLCLITSNPERMEELRAGAAALSRRIGRPIQLSMSTDPEEVLRALPAAQVVLAYRLTPEQFDAASRLEWVHFGAAGVDHSLFPALLDSSAALTTSKGIHSDVMGEYAVMAVIALSCGLPLLMDAQRRRVWAGREVRGLHRSIRGRRLLVLGLGHVGLAAAQKAAELGMRVTGVKRTPLQGPLPGGLTAVHTTERLDELLTEADFLVLALPRTPLTEGLLDARRLRLLPSGAGIVNMARGTLIDETALLEALDEGRLGGAVLDCFASEPLPVDSPFWHHPKVLVTPHMSGNFEAYTRLVIEDFLENLERYLAGDVLRNPIDRSAGY